MDTNRSWRARQSEARSQPRDSLVGHVPIGAVGKENLQEDDAGEAGAVAATEQSREIKPEGFKPVGHGDMLGDRPAAAAVIRLGRDLRPDLFKPGDHAAAFAT